MILITGTGRTGTSFLMTILTFLKLDTGFDESEFEDVSKKVGKAGFEKHLDTGHEFIKNPAYSTRVSEMVKLNYEVSHVILPIRNLEDTIKSRQRVSENDHTDGALVTENIETERIHNLEKVYAVINDCAKYDIPITTLSFPEFARNSEYTWNRLQWLFEQKSISRERFEEVFERISTPEWIHFE